MGTILTVGNGSKVFLENQCLFFCYYSMLLHMLLISFNQCIGGSLEMGKIIYEADICSIPSLPYSYDTS